MNCSQRGSALRRRCFRIKKGAKFLRLVSPLTSAITHPGKARLTMLDMQASDPERLGNESGPFAGDGTTVVCEDGTLARVRYMAHSRYVPGSTCHLSGSLTLSDAKLCAASRTSVLHGPALTYLDLSQENMLGDAGATL
jgi:hypothetical protein